MEKIVSLCKRRGFIFPGSEIYGGLAGTWDYGPLGSELKFNFKQAWWRFMVSDREHIFGMSASVLMHPKVWEASGHTAAFVDPLVECKICHERFRADQDEEVRSHEQIHRANNESTAWTDPKKFNLLVEAKLGAVEGEKATVYLRGEITQSVHVNFKNILDSMHPKLPFGIAQIGRAFRNEITPGNFTYRLREFEQMELQYYVRPDERVAREAFEMWKKERMKWYIALGVRSGKLRFREHAADERAHYARAAWDIEYETPFGWKEAEGIHHRGDWDLSQHAKFSRQELSYFDSDTNERFIPWVIETSCGVERPLLYILLDAYQEDGERVVLKLHPKLAPYRVAVFPLLANKSELVEKARSVLKALRASGLSVAWDDRGNIGKRYYSQDEIGTPWCMTVDFQTLEDDTVTVRDRDTMQQERVGASELAAYVAEKLKSQIRV